MKMNLESLSRILLLAALMAASSVALAATEQPLEATTQDGRKVVLHPDGRWEFGPADGTGATAVHAGDAAKTAPPAASGSANAAARADDRYCIGGLFGVGRRICPGDPDYNRGSLNPKLH